jgi:hypothetical protein
MAAKVSRLTHKIAIQLHPVAESCTICSSRSRRPVRKLLDIASYKRPGDKCFCHNSIGWSSLRLHKFIFNRSQRFTKIDTLLHMVLATWYLNCKKGKEFLWGRSSSNLPVALAKKHVANAIDLHTCPTRYLDSESSCNRITWGTIALPQLHLRSPPPQATKDLVYKSAVRIRGTTN